MPDQPAFPSLTDDELRETLDLMATAVASMSDRIDDLTAVADKQIKVSTEARQAAFAARKQTDPKAFGDQVGRILEDRITDTLQRLEILTNHLEQRTNRTASVLDQASEDRGKALRDLHAREQKLDRWKARLPWVGLGALVLALAIAVTLPRFIAGNATACAVLGASWTTTTTGVDACVFYQR